METTSAISSNHFSVDQQAVDAFDYLNTFHPAEAEKLLEEFPEIPFIKWSLSHFDTSAMGVDEEWGCWLVDAIEEAGVIWWEEGEPFTRFEDGK